MGLFYAWSGLILLVMLLPLPGDKLIWLGSLDSLVHFGLFVVLGGLGWRVLKSNPDRNQIILTILPLLVVVPESLQTIVPTRSFQWLDLFFNAGGAVSGVALATAFEPLLYLGLGSLSMGGAFLSTLFDSSLYAVVFATSFEPFLLPILALDVLLSVLLLALLNPSITKRFLLVTGGGLYLFVLRTAGGVFPMVVSGTLFLLFLAGLYLWDKKFLPEELIRPVTDLSFILLLASGVGVGAGRTLFLLHAGAILGLGVMVGVLFLYTVRSLTYRRTFAESSSGQS